MLLQNPAQLLAHRQTDATQTSAVTSQRCAGFHTPFIIRPPAHFISSNAAPLPPVKHSVFTLHQITLHHSASRSSKSWIPPFQGLKPYPTQTTRCEKARAFLSKAERKEIKQRVKAERLPSGSVKESFFFCLTPPEIYDVDGVFTEVKAAHFPNQFVIAFAYLKSPFHQS